MWFGITVVLGCASRSKRLALFALLAAAPGAQGTIGSFPSVAVPPGNPLTDEKVLLGKALFFEEQLSSDDTMACATCHLPEAGGADARAGARHPGVDGLLGTNDDEFGSSGVRRADAGGDFAAHALVGFQRQPTNRVAPTVFGAAFFDALFWDQRAERTFRDERGELVLPTLAALESQAVAPPVSSVEMAHEQRTWDAVTAKLARVRPLDLASDLPRSLAEFVLGVERYDELFARAFGTPAITRERVAMALASYERTLVPDHTPFDLGTLTPQEALGLQVFRVNGLCESCHPSTPGLFSDGLMHPIHLPDHERAVKTPTLRNVGLRPRLMSSGQFTSLSEAVAHYERIGFLLPLTQANREALLVFLGNGLTDERVLRRAPPFDRPTLRSERVPPDSTLYGRAWPGSGGFVPEMLADSPANLGNVDWRLGLGRALGGATAFLAMADERARPGATFRGVPVAVDLAHATLQAFALSGEGPGNGTRTVHLRVPCEASLLGRERFAQWLVLDPNALGGVSVSRAARIELVSERLRRPPAQAENGGATVR